jgi:molybdopterin-containing oxidoreductase family iron-sulfur binding subunit
VTVRSRGVMEKCTFCIQRIHHAEQTSTLAGQGGALSDGAVMTACAQACPTRAITFGDMNDPKSQVSEILATTDRGYQILAELGTNPSVIYLKKIDPDATAEHGA